MPTAIEQIENDIQLLSRQLEAARQANNAPQAARLAAQLDGLRQALAYLKPKSTLNVQPGNRIAPPRPATGLSLEQQMTTEALPENFIQADGYFGSLFALMRRSLAAGGSEFGLGMSLFSLAVSIQATQILEIGRFKGFSTLCLASALRFLDIGWREPLQHKQRPDVNYAAREQPRARKLYSVDPFPTQEAAALVHEADLARYVEFLDCRSDAVSPKPAIFDLAFIDGDHSYEGCRADVLRFLPSIRPGGYFVLHDYFGWFDAQLRNNSPIKRVADELVATGRFQHLLIDTGYPSLVIFRNGLEGG